MERKKIIRKILVLSAWFVVISGMATLLIAANRKQKKHVCTEVLIGIKGSGEKYYIEKDEVLALIEKINHGSLINKPVTEIDLGRMENALERNAWISHAELYFDSKDAVHVYVEEREPVTRIFTTAGNSFYIDRAGHKMPLLENVSIRLPVVTGFSNTRKWNAQDSALLEDVKSVAGFVYGHSFWNAQIGQIDITADRKFELVPVIGDHLIRIGDARDIDEKLGRLLIFYKQMMSRVGFTKYAVLDVQYEGQIVAMKKGKITAVDSMQLQKNIEALMNKASMQNIDEGLLPEQNITVTPKKDSTVSKMAPVNTVPVKTNSNPIEMKPKAVMKKNDTN